MLLENLSETNDALALLPAFGSSKTWWFVKPVTSKDPAMIGRRLSALPSSRATPVETGSVLRPRWYPDHLPFCNQGCCLPKVYKSSAFICNFQTYSHDHNDTYFRAQSRGLPSRFFWLRNPVIGLTREVHCQPAGQVLIGWAFSGSCPESPTG